MRQLVFAICMMFSIVISAQQFHGAALFDCSGSVKEIKYEKRYPLMGNKKWSFSKDGKLNNSLLSYNDNGYPAGAGFSAGNQMLNLNVVYDSENLLKSLSLQSNVSGKALNMTVEFLFVGNQMAEMKANVVSKDANKIIAFKFSDYKYDSYGNWIERNVVKTSVNIFDQNPESPSEETDRYTEKRIIKYYKD